MLKTITLVILLSFALCFDAPKCSIGNGFSGEVKNIKDGDGNDRCFSIVRPET